MKVRSEKKNARIELIPLIDIIFLLLVFFIYSMLSMVVYRGIPVSLPPADTFETEKGKTVVITIDERGNVFLNREPILSDKLLSRLKKIHAAPPEKGVIVSGHRESHYEVFVDVLDKVRLAGFKKVSMETKPGGRGSSVTSDG